MPEPRCTEGWLPRSMTRSCDCTELLTKHLMCLTAQAVVYCGFGVAARLGLVLPHLCHYSALYQVAHKNITQFCAKQRSTGDTRGRQWWVGDAGLCREELERQQAKEHYEKMHLAGKTDEARADLARLALVKKQREEAAKKREEERKGLFAACSVSAVWVCSLAAVVLIFAFLYPQFIHVLSQPIIYFIVHCGKLTVKLQLD